MFIVILFWLLIVLAVIFMALICYKKCQRISIIEPQRERIEVAKIKIAEIIKEQRELPDVDREQLVQMRTAIDELLTATDGTATCKKAEGSEKNGSNNDKKKEETEKDGIE